MNLPHPLSSLVRLGGLRIYFLVAMLEHDSATNKEFINIRSYAKKCWRGIEITELEQPCSAVVMRFPPLS
jgi:hypothetical protein